MFEWLKEEMNQIKTPKFHLVDGPMPEETKKLVVACELPIPASYREFVIQFGNVNLYRESTYYLVQVYAAPREAVSRREEAMLQFGRTHCSLAYFKEDLLVPNQDSPVFELFGGKSLRQTADGFEPWIRARCKAARRTIKKKKWLRILEGPEPFTDEERAIVNARRRYRWRVVGIAENRDILFEVHNDSDIVLPYLSLGVRGKHGDVIGGIGLRVQHVAPGESAIVGQNCYKDRHDPGEVKLFLEPDPGPEDREVYWEFKNIAR